MSTRRITSKNTTALYLILFVVILVAFLLLGGAAWVKGLFQGSWLINIAHWNWATILISLAIGFILGLLVYRRK